MLGPLLFISFIEKIEKITHTGMNKALDKYPKMMIFSVNDVLLKNLIKISRGKVSNNVDGFPFLIVVFNIINRSLELIQKVMHKSINQL